MSLLLALTAFQFPTVLAGYIWEARFRAILVATLAVVLPLSRVSWHCVKAPATAGADASGRLNPLQLGNAEVEHLHADITEVDLSTRTGTAAFDIHDHAFAELGMLD